MRVLALIFVAICLIANNIYAMPPADVAAKDTAGTFVKLAEIYHDSTIAPLLLFRASSVYLYKLNDEDSARAAFRKLLDHYPASDLASPKTVLYKRLSGEAAEPFDVEYRISKLLWEEGLLQNAADVKNPCKKREISDVKQSGPGRLEKRLIADIAAVPVETTDRILKLVLSPFALKTEGRQAFSELINNDQKRAHALFTRKMPFSVENLKVGSRGEIAICAGWQGTARSELVGIRGVTVRRRGADRVVVNGIIRTAGVDFDAHLVGRREARSGGYIVEECRLGSIDIPPMLVNDALRKFQ